MVREDDDKIDLEEIAEGEDQDVAAAESPKGGGIGGIMARMRGQLPRILGFTLGAIVVIIVSVLISGLVFKAGNQGDVLTMGEELKEKPDAFKPFDIGEFRINLSDKTETHIISVKMFLAYDGENILLGTELNNRRRQLRHTINMTLADFQKSELEGNEGKERLKYSLMDNINNILQYGEIEDIYYDELYVQ